MSCPFHFIILIMQGPDTRPFSFTRNSFTMVCPPIRGDNPRALAKDYLQERRTKHGVTILESGVSPIQKPWYNCYTPPSSV